MILPRFLPESLWSISAFLILLHSCSIQQFRAVSSSIGQGELAELAGSFQTMTEALAEQRSEILAFQSELQQRVDDRTASLRLASRELIERRERAALTSMGAGLAHELNNPLSSVLGISQMLRASSDVPPRSDALLGKLEGEAERCRNIVHQMLKLTEITDAEANRVPFRLNDLVNDVVQQVVQRFGERKIHLQLAEGLDCAVTADRARVAAVLTAVFDALLGWVPYGSTIHIRTEGAERSAQIVWELSDMKKASLDGWSPNQEVMGYAIWVAREMAHRAGGRLDTSEGETLCWRWMLTGEGDA